MGRSTRSTNATGKAPTPSTAAKQPTNGKRKSNQPSQDEMPVAGISMAAFSIYKTVQAQLDAKKKEAKEAEDAGEN